MGNPGEAEESWSLVENRQRRTNVKASDNARERRVGHILAQSSSSRRVIVSPTFNHTPSIVMRQESRIAHHKGLDRPMTGGHHDDQWISGANPFSSLSRQRSCTSSSSLLDIESHIHF